MDAGVAYQPGWPTGSENEPTVVGRYRAVKDEIAATFRSRVSKVRETDVRPVISVDADALLSEIKFPVPVQPLVDVIIPCYNEFEKTVECLAALCISATRTPMRVIVVDDCSTDPRFAQFADIAGVDYRRNSVNLQFLRSCNQAYTSCSAPYVLLLNNDTQVIGPAIDHLVAELERDPTVAAAAPKMLYPNGRLQEAGCSIDADGNTQMIGVGADPTLPQYRRDRDIAYGSGACLLVRRSDVGQQLFDPRFAPAYCEDVDLCLRLRSGDKRVRYIANAQVVHHLSPSMSRESESRRVQLARRNQQKLLEKWGSRLAEDCGVRVLAFYLPQFHPVEENDLWWGRGFTEWTNVTKALPSYEGHYQPHLPADLGFYDLRLPETMEAQQTLAHRYGIAGFVMYYYNFDGSRLLGRPLENLLANPNIDFRFCLCWANENWTKHWDGNEERAALRTQDYGIDTICAVADDAVAAARLPGSIQVDGVPLFLIYRPLLLPNPKATCEFIRARFQAAGFEGVHLTYVESMETAGANLAPGELGFDSSVEFPPHGIARPSHVQRELLKPRFSGNIFDYAGTVVDDVVDTRRAYKRYPCVFPSWDNTPRQPMAHTTLEDASPEVFQAYVEAKLDVVHEEFCGDERIMFVNAWNEWAEGAHLEPDQAFGHDWLRAIRDALANRMWPAGR